MVSAAGAVAYQRFLHSLPASNSPLTKKIAIGAVDDEAPRREGIVSSVALYFSRGPISTNPRMG
jgi:hypothetical protein